MTSETPGFAEQNKRDSGGESADKPAPRRPDVQVPDPSELADSDLRTDDISGIDNFIEEGAPLEPQDFIEDATETASGTDEEPTDVLAEELAERTADLQRLQAEFLNYKRRVDRDRELVKQNAVFSVLTPMLDVLDNIDRAREAGELTGGFQALAVQLETIVSNLGLARYGEPGDPFDPNLHDALSHVGTDPEVAVQTAKHIAKAGYKIGDRVVRPAQVLVVDPVDDGETAAQASDRPADPGDA